MHQATAPDSTDRGERLFGLLKLLCDLGTRFAPISRVDELVDRARSAFVIKHDVHGLSLKALLEFAETELALEVTGTYFFMAPDHPLTQPAYSFAEQVEAMRRVRAMGHEIGLHLDPYFLMHHLGLPLGRLLERILRRFEDAGVPLRCGNMHGNSRFKMPDRNGYGTSFDLFEQLGRQQDYPTLADVPENTARTIRENRVSLADFGFTHWADMPLWSARHGFVVTNFITDNQLGKRGTIEIVTHEHTRGQYKLADAQPPGSRTPAAPRRFVPCEGSSPLVRFPTGSVTLEYASPETTDWFENLADEPTLFLVHPEHYV